MAKTDKTTPAADTSAATDQHVITAGEPVPQIGVQTPVVVVPGATEGPTPDNTPVPGGGRWRWDIAGPGWVEV